jgi:hypothetical protein
MEMEVEERMIYMIELRSRYSILPNNEEGREEGDMRYNTICDIATPV